MSGWSPEPWELFTDNRPPESEEEESPGDAVLLDDLAHALAEFHGFTFDAVRGYGLEYRIEANAILDRVRRFADAQVAAERERYERVGCMAGGMLMRGHFGPCNEDGHEPVYRIARGRP